MTRNYPRHFCYATYTNDDLHVWPRKGRSIHRRSCFVQQPHTHTPACMRNVDYDPLIDTVTLLRTVDDHPTAGTVVQCIYTVQYSGHIYTHVCSLYMHVRTVQRWGVLGARWALARVVVPHNCCCRSREPSRPHLATLSCSLIFFSYNKLINNIFNYDFLDKRAAAMQHRTGHRWTC